MKRYSAYKNSGVKWIGEIPTGWSVRKIKYIFNERSVKGYPDEPVLCSTQKYGVIPQSMYENRVVVVNKGLEGLKLVRKGDFVISLRSFQGGIEYAHYQGIISAAYTVLALNPGIDANFMKYLLKSYKFVQLLQTCVTGIREGQNINYGLLRKNSIALPSLPEQGAIVLFLDDKIGKIDHLTDQTTALIERLKELKQSVIARAVTRGLDPNAKMKPSGISWIGEIPENWEVSKIRSLFRERNEKVSDKDWEALSVSKDGILPQLSTAVKTDNGDNRKKVCKGDFVVNSRSDRKGSCGFSDYDGSVSLINIVLKPINVLGKYYHYLFRSNDYIEEFYRNGKGIVADLWTTRYSEMRNIAVPLPPISEQKRIADYIEAETSKIDKLIVDKTREVELLKELRQRTISDAVTGKIKVTD